MKSILSFSLSIILCVACQSEKHSSINIWYGDEQTFGKPGNAQRQINLLGNLKNLTPATKLSYTLNNDTTQYPLTLGSDLHRLAKKGDFNIEIDRRHLKSGENIVEVLLYEDDVLQEHQTIKINYVGANSWSLPYQVEWQKVENIQEAVQVVDGHWQLKDNGLQTKNAYYDRIIAVGDSTWQDYEIETSVIFHDYNTPVPGPPTYNVAHVALAVRWPGHDVDSLQPNRKWYPLGATAEFRITDEYDSCRWRIFDGEHFYAEQPSEDYRRIEPEKEYQLKHRVQNMGDTIAIYRVKLWSTRNKEPEAWDFEATENLVKKESGSACLIAHHTRVTFGDISVKPLKPGNRDSQ